MRKRKVPLSTKPDLASLSKEGEEVAAEVALERAAEKMSTSMDWEDSRTSSWWW